MWGKVWGLRRGVLLILTTVAVWAGFAAAAVAQGSVESDRLALEAFYDATGGAGWMESKNWKTSAPLGEWYGVTTDAAGRVTRLELTRNGLTGQIPAALGSLSNLTVLWIRLNALRGQIPEELGRLARLERLSLHANELTGPIPASLGSLSRLGVLWLSQNELTGPIPDSLQRLANLDYLDLSQNQLTGSIPEWLGNLSRLRRLSLSSNALSGPIPDALEGLDHLEYLDLSLNELTGRIPDALGSLSRLRDLSLNRNALAGPIPDALGGLNSLEWLGLRSNTLTGPVPASLANLVQLRSLLLSQNPLSGTLPRELTRLSRLRALWIRDTAACAPADPEFQEWLATVDFVGETCNRPPQPVDTIPAQTLVARGPAVGVAPDPYFTDPDDDPLTYSAVSGNEGAVTAFVSGDTVWLTPMAAGTATVTVTASDPDGLRATQAMPVTTVASAGPQSDREVLEVFYDSTGGPGWTNRTNWKTPAPLREWFGVTTDDAGRLTALGLNDNGLTGPIPAMLGDLARLEHMDLGRNELVGPIPNELGNLVNLENLTLGSNELTGPIPEELGNLVNIESLNLRSNELTGQIPEELGRPVNLRRLDLGRNALTGGIPASLGNLANVTELFLNNNDLTGPIPGELAELANLVSLDLGGNALTGRIPARLGNLTSLRGLSLGWNDLSGPIPDELGRLNSLLWLNLGDNWGLTGPLPAGLQMSGIRALDIFITQACAPAELQEWLEEIRFLGRVCESRPDVTIDVAVVYTPAAREWHRGTAAIEAKIDLLVAEANEFHAASGVNHRLALVERSEVAYAETGNSSTDLLRLAHPDDGHMDDVHALRDRVGADLVHLMVIDSDVAGRAYLGGAFGLILSTTGQTFAHELGHNMGLSHDRYQVHHNEGGARPHPAYGYVNQRGLEEGGRWSRHWKTIMAIGGQCSEAYIACWHLNRFSNPRQSYNGDPVGVPHGNGETGVAGPADAVAVLNATGPAVAAWRDRPGANRRPAVAETLSDRELTLPGTQDVDVSGAFVDPDGDTLAYGVSSSAPNVVAVGAAGTRVKLTAVSLGTATVRVTATDPGGRSAAQSFTVTVTPKIVAPFTDDPLQPGVTPVKAVHFVELRQRIDALRAAAGLGRQRWTDPVLRAGVTPVRLEHLTELRSALEAVYSAAGRPVPRWTDPAPVRGVTPIRAVHLTELRAAVVALE